MGWCQLQPQVAEFQGGPTPEAVQCFGLSSAPGAPGKSFTGRGFPSGLKEGSPLHLALGVVAA